MDEHAKVIFSTVAMEKMSALITQFDKEVAWHGVVFRHGTNTYFVNDILVYPQEVSAASVEMDTTKYTEWLMDNAEDERFSNLYMQGHSHVDMAVLPSGTDLRHQKEIFGMVRENGFYIFMIWNKSFEYYVNVFDAASNQWFSTSECDLHIADAYVDIDEFIAEAQGMVKERRENIWTYLKAMTTFSPKREQNESISSDAVLSEQQ